MCNYVREGLGLGFVYVRDTVALVTFITYTAP
jgi:hypothetical protein